MDYLWPKFIKVYTFIYSGFMLYLSIDEGTKGEGDIKCKASDHKKVTQKHDGKKWSRINSALTVVFYFLQLYYNFRWNIWLLWVLVASNVNGNVKNNLLKSLLTKTYDSRKIVKKTFFLLFVLITVSTTKLEDWFLFIFI